MKIPQSAYRVFIATCLLLTSLSPLLHGADVIGKAPYEPTWESVNRHNPGGTAPEWIKDAKFGIYYHWGAYSVPAFRSSGFGEWYGKWMNTPGHKTSEHHAQVFGDPATSVVMTFVAGLMAFASLAKAEDKFVIAGGPYKPTWESLKQYQCPEGFRDAKFGIWAHWGVQCQPEMGDWYAWHMYRPAPGSGIYKLHCDTYGHPSVFGLKDLCNA